MRFSSFSPAHDREHRYELEYLVHLIQWRLKLCEQTPHEFNADNAYFWRFALPGREVPSEAEEHAAHLFERGEYERAASIFRLLLETFDDYAEGYNYLGLIALEQEHLDEAIAHFEKTVEVGRRLFPRRIARKEYWQDLSTRPYVRGLRNLTFALNVVGRYEDALQLCERLESECNDDLSAGSYRAAVYLNLGRWELARDTAMKLLRVWPEESYIAAFGALELGERREAVASFLHAALNHPLTARMLVGERTRAPANYEEARDHNAGVTLQRSLRGYLSQQSAASRRFFRQLLRRPEVTSLLEEMETVVRRRDEQHPTGEREAFDRMMLMHSLEFARDKAGQIALNC